MISFKLVSAFIGFIKPKLNSGFPVMSLIEIVAPSDFTNPVNSPK